MPLFHDGERRMQARAGELVDERIAGRIIVDHIIPPARPFLASQSLFAAASIAADGSPWCSLLLGPPGFVSADERTLTIDRRRLHRDEGDPLWNHLAQDPRLGLVAMDLATRRRYRINGRVELDDDVVHLAVVEAYPNCPKYIHRRELQLGASRPVGSDEQRSALSEADRQLLQRTDTVFTASNAPAGMPDASHRGGLPGFLEVLPDGRLRFPDYTGNGLFNTWGNLALDPRVGLAVPDAVNGRLLQIAGDVELLWDQPDPTGRTAGTQRFWTVTPRRIRSSSLPVTMTWDAGEASPYSPAV